MTEDSWQARDRPSYVAAIVGLLWGLATAFATAFPDPLSIDGIVLIAVALVAISVAAAKGLWKNASAPVVYLTTLHAAVAFVLGLMYGSPVPDIVRYVSIPVAAWAIAIFCATRGGAAGLRLGLTSSGVLFGLWHLPLINFADITDPISRLSVFMGPNSIGFIVAATSLSLFEYAISQQRWGTKILLWVGWAALLLVTFATKSRTPIVAALATMSVIVIRRYGARRFVIGAASLVIVLLLVDHQYLIDAWNFVSDALGLESQYRTNASASGRYDIWSFLTADVIPQRPFFGFGPGYQFTVGQVVGPGGAHNGLLALIIDVGIVGTLPLLILCANTIWRGRKGAEGYRFFAPFVVFCAIESIGEQTWFSVGNPASLMLLLSIAASGVHQYAGKSGITVRTIPARNLIQSGGVVGQQRRDTKSAPGS